MRISLGDQSADPNLSGGQRRNLPVSRQNDPAKDQVGDGLSRGSVDASRSERLPPSAQHRADPAGTAAQHRFVGGMRSSIEEEDESLEL